MAKYYYLVRATIVKTIAVEANDEYEADAKIDDKMYEIDFLKNGTILDDISAELYDVETEE